MESKRLDINKRRNPFTACQCIECEVGEVSINYHTMPQTLSCDTCSARYTLEGIEIKTTDKQ